jgi:hypothetical protein
MNSVQHTPRCVACGKEYICTNPECMTLKGFHGVCPRCSYLHGWAQAKDRRFYDEW